jgi:aspartyl aminopeptidase
MAKEKTAAKKLQEKLFNANKHAGLTMGADALAASREFCEGYKAFLDASKTERKAVNTALEMAKKRGYREYKPGDALKTGDKIYLNNRGKAVVFAIIGSEPFEKGSRVVAAHIDSPRVDLKQNPLYEESELALLKTHYYGGIKKYQWTAVPLALCGVIVKKDGSVLDISIGEGEGDPVFCICDLLPHLAAEQYKRHLNDGVKGEELNVLAGSMPFEDNDEIKEKVKLSVLSLLNEKYGVVEADFASAELELVPAHKARDIGFDRSMVGAYGQDDRVCAYTALQALLDCKKVKKTAVVALADKEETGSDGNTGLKSSYLEYFLCDVADALGSDGRRAISASECLSADVNAAFDPTFPDVFEKKNASYLNHGVCVSKYTGSRGKSGTSDASAEFVGKVRALLDKNKVIWQTGELGKVDLGGGGTVAAYLANLGMDVLDAGVPVLSMHSPFEITAKTDIYMAYKAFLAFMSNG